MKKEGKKKLRIKMISLRQLQKVSFGSGIGSAEEDTHKRKMEEVLKGKGLVYAYCENKAVIAYFLFIRDTALLPSAVMEPEQALELVKGKIIKPKEGKVSKEEDRKPAQDETNTAAGEEAAAGDGAKAKEKPQNVFRLTESFILPAYEEEKAEMKKTILADLKERIQLEDYQGILWEDEVIQKKKVRLGAVSCSLGLIFGVAMAMLFSTVFDNIGIGILFGISFGISMSVAFME